MYGAKYVWFLLGWYQQRWWEDKNDTACTPDQLATVVDGYFAVDSLNTNVKNIKSVSGLVSGIPCITRLLEIKISTVNYNIVLF